MAKSLSEATQKRAALADQITEKTSKQNNKSQNDRVERCTYYIPREKHRRLKMLALQKDMNVSALAEEGIDYILEKYGS